MASSKQHNDIPPRFPSSKAESKKLQPPAYPDQKNGEKKKSQASPPTPPSSTSAGKGKREQSSNSQKQQKTPAVNLPKHEQTTPELPKAETSASKASEPELPSSSSVSPSIAPSLPRAKKEQTTRQADKQKAEQTKPEIPRKNRKSTANAHTRKTLHITRSSKRNVNLPKRKTQQTPLPERRRHHVLHTKTHPITPVSLPSASSHGEKSKPQNQGDASRGNANSSAGRTALPARNANKDASTSQRTSGRPNTPSVPSKPIARVAHASTRPANVHSNSRATSTSPASSRSIGTRPTSARQSGTRPTRAGAVAAVAYRDPLPLKRHKVSRKMLWRDTRRSLGKSIGRFISIVCMVALGSFALVGLHVTGPDMRSTADDYFSSHQLADLSVTSKVGFDDPEINAINGAQDVTKVEYGSFKDVAVKGHDDSVRIFSSTKSISSYEVRRGKMPSKPGEIALDEQVGGKHRIGSTVSFDEKPDAAGRTMLKSGKYKVTGIVRSSEIISPVNHGQSDSGSGTLDGYGVVVPQAFNKGKYNIARLRYDVLDSMPDHFSDTYVKKMHQEKDLLNDALDNRDTSSAADTSQSQQPQQPQATTPAAQSGGQTEEPNEAKTNNLVLYNVVSRSEVPGGTGYASYETISRVVDSLATIFPIFMYLIAALLTFTSMTRFVEEDRINAGTLKALGYTNRDVIKKFLVYGCTAGVIGGLVGGIAGELVMPKILYGAYAVGFALPAITPQFNWQITAFALVLALAVTMLPAYGAAHRELKEHTRALLRPKPPTGGSSIALEKMKWLWNSLNFKYKITMRNIFRYRVRTLMTIIGVCGSVALLVAGIGVQHSIATINDLQYKDGIINYDLIAAQRPDIKSEQKAAVNKKLKGDDIKNATSIRYEHVTMDAGPKDAKQDITVIAPTPDSDLDSYVRLQDRKTHMPLMLKSKGAVISERLSKLTGAKAGDDIKVTDSEGNQRVVPITGVCEMYIGHFVFMSSRAYEKIFHEKYSANAKMIELKDRSSGNARHEAAQFMHTDGISAVAQNSMLINQTQVLANALTIIMEVLTLASVLLDVVILYNLNNLNLSERKRELSTIKVLGYSNGETTLYIYRETIILSILGIALGIALGMGLHQQIISTVEPDTMLFDPKFTASEFSLPLIVIALVTFVLGLYVMLCVRHVDMLKALQARE